MSNSDLQGSMKGIFREISKDFDDFKPLIFASKKAKVDPGQLIVGGFLVILVLIFIGTAESLLTAIIGLIYPSYMSFKAIEGGSQDSIAHWLIYWIVFGFLSLADSLLGFFLKFIPFFYLIKILFLVWLFYPKTKGALLLYNDFVKPQLEKHQDKIDKFLNRYMFISPAATEKHQ